jgi:YVTN family beta-propeller protein
LAYVSNETSNTLSVIDVAAEKVIATVPVGMMPFAVAIPR